MLKPGALRFQNPDGSYQEYNPGHRMYSTAIMVATEYWDPDDSVWKKIPDIPEVKEDQNDRPN